MSNFKMKLDGKTFELTELDYKDNLFICRECIFDSLFIKEKTRECIAAQGHKLYPEYIKQTKADISSDNICGERTIDGKIKNVVWRQIDIKKIKPKKLNL